MSRYLRRRTLRPWEILAVGANPTFRCACLGMGVSYAGDRLQILAQAWLVAVLTRSTLAVGLVTALGIVPTLLWPVGGAIAERVDRRRLLAAGQLVGAGGTLLVALLALSHHLALWHVYVWSIGNGLIGLVSRPAYKVLLTDLAPDGRVARAVAFNAILETCILVVVNAVGGAMLAALGLPLAFLLNTTSYLIAAACVISLVHLGYQAPFIAPGSSRPGLWRETGAGLRYLAQHPALLRPLLLTFAAVAAAGPVVSVLPALVHAHEGSIADAGVLTAVLSTGCVAGAAVAGAQPLRRTATRVYALLGLVIASALVLFARAPVGLVAWPPLGVIGAVLFMEGVWNTSRVPTCAAPTYQARMQALTSMVFNLGVAFGALWAGAAIDRWGSHALVGGAIVLGMVSLAIAVVGRREIEEMASTAFPAPLP